MDKILTARVDESVVQRVDRLAKQLKTTKRRVIQDAIARFAEQIDRDTKEDILERTFGAWQRDESVVETVQNAKQSFREVMMRHQE